MCLAVPGRILNLTDTGELTRAGRVDFGGVIREVNLALVPEATVNDYVLVHVGLALSRIEETEARQTLDYLRQIDELGELERTPPLPPPPPPPPGS